MKIFSLLVFAVSAFFTNPNSDSKKEFLSEAELVRFNTQVTELKAFLNSDGTYNTKIAFLIDMRIKSGKNRFFVYDLVNDKILDQGLVANGSGSETEIRGNLKFSNEPNSNCTSLGNYSIGKPYTGIFGKSYKLSGLDATNNNAIKRAIVLHSYSAVPEEEQDHYIALSHGCPMVSEAFFKKLATIIDASKSNIVLNIYY